MDLNLCKQCDMKLNYYVSDQDSKLYLGCKVCGHKEEHTGTTCIYNNDYWILDIFRIFQTFWDPPEKVICFLGGLQSLPRNVV